MEIRVFDCWYHDQDIREALGRPGFLEGPVADLSLGRIPPKALGYVVGKKAGAPPGSVGRVRRRGLARDRRRDLGSAGGPRGVARRRSPRIRRRASRPTGARSPASRAGAGRAPTPARTASSRRGRRRARRPRRRQHGVHDLDGAGVSIRRSRRARARGCARGRGDRALRRARRLRRHRATCAARVAPVLDVGERRGRDRSRSRGRAARDPAGVGARGGTAVRARVPGQRADGDRLAIAAPSPSSRRRWRDFRSRSRSCGGRGASAGTPRHSIQWRSCFGSDSSARSAALCIRHGTDGRPPVSSAASNRPPSIERFFRNWMRWPFFAAGSRSSQKRCPASVVGTREPASTSAATRGNFPIARAAPAAICTAPLTRTHVVVSPGSPSASVTGSTTGSARPSFDNNVPERVRPAVDEHAGEHWAGNREEKIHTACFMQPAPE